MLPIFKSLDEKIRTSESQVEGFARWSLRLLADKMVELEYIDKISYETVRRVLKKTSYVPGKSKDGS